MKLVSKESVEFCARRECRDENVVTKYRAETTYIGACV